MGLYNAVFGMHPKARDIVKSLGLTLESFERFRDAFVTNGEIAIYTRLGGRNRAAYQHVFETMRQHPLYLRDQDDDFDYTYCTFYFKIPDDAQHLKDYDIGTFDPDKRWQDAFDLLKSDPNEVLRVNDQLEKYVKIIKID
jgi:hypothetical protein